MFAVTISCINSSFARVAFSLDLNPVNLYLGSSKIYLKLEIFHSLKLSGRWVIVAESCHLCFKGCLFYLWFKVLNSKDCGFNRGKSS